MLTQSQKEDIFQFIRSLKTSSFAFRDLVRYLNLDSDDRRSLQKYLDELDAQDILHRVKRGRYSLPVREPLISGVLTCHPDGYGFVVPDDHSHNREDIFIPPGNMADALHGDTVLIKIRKKKRPVRRDSRGRPVRSEPVERAEGFIVRVLERKSPAIVGRFYEHPRFPFVVPLDSRLLHDIRIPYQAAGEAKNGQIVVAALTIPPGRNHAPEGRITEILGYPEDPGIEYRVVPRKFGLPVQFHPETIRQAQAIPDHILKEECCGREDFRGQLAVTIDGETAHDFDDAVTLERSSSGNYLLGVHIADVSHYVREGSALDRDAYERGTSVYFPDRAIPMLPPGLSSGICSLKPNEDRLVFSVLMEVDSRGKVVSSRFAEGLIRSRARMTYTSLASILENKDKSECGHYPELIPVFEMMKELCLILSKVRERRGAVDFDLPEAEIQFDENGKVLAVVPAERNIAHRIIEEFMLLANETVARRLTAWGGPALYRVHDKPDTLKVQAFAELALALGYKLEGPNGQYRPRDFQKFAAQLEGKTESRFLSYLMLRSFMQARYSEKNTGHFGLATAEYTHFTAPIRRYPDLVVHRLLKECLRENPSEAWLARMKAKMPEIAAHVSARERIADEAEREIERVKKAQFMADKVGGEFDALVFSVMRQGLYVELLDHYVEGFVPAATLIDDDYHYRERTHTFIGDRRRRRFELGSKVRVRLDNVDPESFRLTFSIV